MPTEAFLTSPPWAISSAEDVNTYIIDVDGTLCWDPPVSESGERLYARCEPRADVIRRVRELYSRGHIIILHTARCMRTTRGDMAAIQARVGPVLTEWLRENGVPYHALVYGKPWGNRAFYVDDRSLTVQQFLGPPAEHHDMAADNNSTGGRA